MVVWFHVYLNEIYINFVDNNYNSKIVFSYERDENYKMKIKKVSKKLKIYKD